MTSPTRSAADTRRRWRLLTLAVGLLCLLVLVASALPWFTETRTFADGTDTSKAINIWTEGPGGSSGSRAGTVAAMAGSGQWGMFVMIAAGLGALLSGLFLRGHHPGDPRIGTALWIVLGGAVVAPIFALLALAAANDGDRVTATPHVGFLLTVPALVAWAVCAVMMWRMARAAKAAGQRAW